MAACPAWTTSKATELSTFVHSTSEQSSVKLIHLVFDLVKNITDHARYGAISGVCAGNRWPSLVLLAFRLCYANSRALWLQQPPVSPVWQCCSDRTQLAHGTVPRGRPHMFLARDDQSRSSTWLPNYASRGRMTWVLLCVHMYTNTYQQLERVCAMGLPLSYKLWVCDLPLCHKSPNHLWCWH